VPEAFKLSILRRDRHPLQHATSLHSRSIYSSFQGHAALRPIRNEEDFARIHSLTDTLADTVGDGFHVDIGAFV
jgi:hypothetical protein